MGKLFISQNIGKETSPYSIQLDNAEGGYWEDARPFKNIVRYNSGASGHLSGESMDFRIWPVVDPNYLELRYARGNDGTFSWRSTKDEKSVIYEDSRLYCPGGYIKPFYCNFSIYCPMSNTIAQTLELEVFLGGESEEFINLGTLYLIYDSIFPENK